MASAVDKNTLGGGKLAAEDKSVQFLNDHVNNGVIAWQTNQRLDRSVQGQQTEMTAKVGIVGK